MCLTNKEPQAIIATIFDNFIPFGLLQEPKILRKKANNEYTTVKE